MFLILINLNNPKKKSNLFKETVIPQSVRQLLCDRVMRDLGYAVMQNIDFNSISGGEK